MDAVGIDGFDPQRAAVAQGSVGIFLRTAKFEAAVFVCSEYLEQPAAPGPESAAGTNVDFAARHVDPICVDRQRGIIDLVHAVLRHAAHLESDFLRRLAVAAHVSPQVLYRFPHGTHIFLHRGAELFLADGAGLNILRADMRDHVPQLILHLPQIIHHLLYILHLRGILDISQISH